LGFRHSARWQHCCYGENNSRGSHSFRHINPSMDLID
jgi:hypothetical protein